MSGARSAGVEANQAALTGGAHSQDERQAQWLRNSVALVAAAAAAMKDETLL